MGSGFSWNSGFMQAFSSARSRLLGLENRILHVVGRTAYPRYIRVGFFTDYRNLAWHYYATNETTYASCIVRHFRCVAVGGRTLPVASWMIEPGISLAEFDFLRKP